MSNEALALVPEVVTERSKPRATTGPGDPTRPALEQLPPHRARLVQTLIASGFSVKATAVELGVNERNLRRTLTRDRLVKRAVGEATREALQGSLLRAQHLHSRALSRLEGLLDHKNSWIVLEAARALVDAALRSAQALDFEDRLRGLEERAAER